jgi:alginate O-acetyltransferase complex protein AlgI
MSFTSLQFAAFVAIVLVVYYAYPQRVWQTSVLVASSIFFYGSDNVQLLPVLAVAVGITFVAIRLGSQASFAGAALGIAINLALLGFFKYKFLFLDPNDWAASESGWLKYLMLLPLPIGISFFVFHNISAIADYFRAGRKNIPGLVDLSLYILFFPQLISGPITRARAFFPQIETKKVADIPVVQVIKLLILGYFMKLYVANNLNEFTTWMAPETMGKLGGGDRLLMIFLYSFQIYADFFGYSTIALGLALLFGYRLPVNFRLPYTAVSFSDFWTRWHISLSSWLRNYLYIPLGGNRGAAWRTYVNLMIVMGLGGLWHGASVNYLCWGLVHGVLLAFERAIGLKQVDEHSRWIVMRIAVVFIAVSFAWLLFRFVHFEDMLNYVKGMRGNFAFNFAPEIYLAAMLSALPVILQHFVGDRTILQYFVRDETRYSKFQPVLYGGMLALAVFARGPETTFIYFRF